jgi:hypothetical protein
VELSALRAVLRAYASTLKEDDAADAAALQVRDWQPPGVRRAALTQPRAQERLLRMSAALKSLAARTPRPSIAELQAEGSFLALVELLALFDAARDKYTAGSGHTLERALELQGLVYAGFSFRFFAPNRPGVLRKMGIAAGCTWAGCRAHGCLGNHVDANGYLHVVHDKTEAAHGARPQLACPLLLLQLLKEWKEWARALVLGEALDTGALFLYHTTGAAMTPAQSSAYLPAVIRAFSGGKVHITHTSVRPPRAGNSRLRSASHSARPRRSAVRSQWRCAFAAT